MRENRLLRVEVWVRRAATPETLLAALIAFVVVCCFIIFALVSAQR